MVEDFPFNESKKNGYTYRVFLPEVDDEELKWHFDEKTRNVEILISNQWLFQRDNHLPKVLLNGDELTIKAGEYHRVIKGHGVMVIRYTEE